MRLEPGRPPTPYRPLPGPPGEPTDRPLKRYVVQAHHPKRYWEHISDHDSEDRALLQALHMARVGKVAFRVWDRKKGKEVWRGYGQGARVEKWKEMRPAGLVGSNPMKRHRIEYMRADGRVVKMRLPAPFANIVARYILKYRHGALTYEGVPYDSYGQFVDRWGGVLGVALPNRDYGPAQGISRVDVEDD